MLKNTKIAAGVLAAIALSAAPALATVTINFVSQDTSIGAPGQTATVDIMATFSESIVGWNLDLAFSDDAIVSVTDVTLGSDWTDTPSSDLSGLSLFGVTGSTLLATVEFTGLVAGLTDLGISIDGEAQGFVLNPPPPNSYDADVVVNTGTIEVVPEPASLALLALGALAVCRRR